MTFGYGSLTQLFSCPVVSIEDDGGEGSSLTLYLLGVREGWRCALQYTDADLSTIKSFSLTERVRILLDPHGSPGALSYSAAITSSRAGGISDSHVVSHFFPTCLYVECSTSFLLCDFVG